MCTPGQKPFNNTSVAVSSGCRLPTRTPTPWERTCRQTTRDEITKHTALPFVPAVLYCTQYWPSRRSPGRCRCPTSPSNVQVKQEAEPFIEPHEWRPRHDAPRESIPCTVPTFNLRVHPVGRTVRVGELTKSSRHRRSLVYGAWHLRAHASFNSTPMAVNSISSSSPHVRPMGRACGEPDEIKKNTHPKKFTALFRERTHASLTWASVSLYRSN